ncbi:hypothetical protein AYI69_g227 [Smittium culicis]|uniref:Uncharacterized protein n=1 Tax=Smittium culicis TaxID=133412 RepID=A0A1R1YTY5_9FUNG|nr:hypothetical protein AYI69_g10901 [Smittium culicis]OMJ19475.1 hypothetical protein AYI69_g6608 [Smittium culicis]OMJ30236.1 hypothetical protein AYI69_g227 [Smittium culicis]
MINFGNSKKHKALVNMSSFEVENSDFPEQFNSDDTSPQHSPPIDSPNHFRNSLEDDAISVSSIDYQSLTDPPEKFKSIKNAIGKTTDFIIRSTANNDPQSGIHSKVEKIFSKLKIEKSLAFSFGSTNTPKNTKPNSSNTSTAINKKRILYFKDSDFDWLNGPEADDLFWSETINTSVNLKKSNYSSLIEESTDLISKIKDKTNFNSKHQKSGTLLPQGF